MKLCTGQVGMLSGVVFACGACPSGNERVSNIITYTWYMHSAYIKVVVSCTKYNKTDQSHGLWGPGRASFSIYLQQLGCHNGKVFYLFIYFIFECCVYDRLHGRFFAKLANCGPL